MSEAWKSYPGAPPVGAVLCPADDVPERGVLSLEIGDFPVLVVRKSGGFLAYVNACPHQYLPLDFRSKQVLSADGEKLICSNHDAVFDLETGAGIGGYGQGCELDAIKVVLHMGHVVIAD